MSQADNNHEGIYAQVEDLLNMRHISKDLKLSTRKQSRSIMGGPVRTRYRGRGMEFSEVRPYQPGDDIRTIDWRVTARVQQPYTKLFQEEKERPIFVMVDQRSPMFFGSKMSFKSCFAAQLAAVIAWIANNNNDRIGGLVFGDEQQRDIRARRGKHALMDLVQQLANQNKSLQSPIAPAHGIQLHDMLKEVARIAHPGSLVMLLSDFHDYTPACREPLSQIARSSDARVIHIYDPMEKHLPPLSSMVISDGEQRVQVNANQLAKNFQDSFNRRQDLLLQDCNSTGVMYIHAPIETTVEDFAKDLFTSRRTSVSRHAGGRR